MSGRTAAAFAVLWLTLLGATVALSAAAAANDTLPGDTRIMSWAQGLAFPGRTLADAVRAVTSTPIVLAAGAALALLLWQRGLRREALVLAAGLIVLPALQFGIKEIVDRPRPGMDAVEIRASYSSPSFPSGHVMGSTYLYGYLIYLALSLHLRAAARAPLVAASAAVLVLSGPAAVWLGVHWPSDVLGGYAWGTALLAPAIATGRRPHDPT